MADDSEKNEKKRRRRAGTYLYLVFIVVLVSVMLFSAFKIISISLDYSQGESEYKDIAESFVVEYNTISIPKKDNALTSADTSEQTSEPESADTSDLTMEDTDISPDTSAPNTEAEDDVLVIPSINSQYLKSVNPDYKGWLYIDGIVINYPVVQCADNDYYLDHTFYGQKNPNGCLFIDYRLDLESDNYNTLIYGHAMKTGAMFGLLLRYQWPGFFEENQHIVYVTEDGPYLITVFSAYTVSTDSDAWRIRFEDDEDYGAWLRSIKSQSNVRCSVTPTTSDRIVTLTTCSFKFDDARFVVHGIIEPLF